MCTSVCFPFLFEVSVLCLTILTKITTLSVLTNFFMAVMKRHDPTQLVEEFISSSGFREIRVHCDGGDMAARSP